MRASSPPPASLDWAFFFDFDGTLIDIADTPDAVLVTPNLVQALERLWLKTGGAVALISGRSLKQIDAFVRPLKLPAAGQHGYERRDGQGRIHGAEMPAHVIATLETEMQALGRQTPALLLEHKGASLALHYRAAPELAEALRERMQALAIAFADYVTLQEGKMVFELKPKGASKGVAIEAFMDEPPFSGRRPMFAGDDVTDEDGFDAVNARGGISIRIHHGEADTGQPTAARFTLESPPQLLDWLAQTVHP